MADRFWEPREIFRLRPSSHHLSSPAHLNSHYTRPELAHPLHLCTPVHRASLSPVLSLEATYRPGDTLAYGCPAPCILLDFQLDTFSCFSVSLSSHRLSSGARIRKRATDRYLQATHQRLSAHSQSRVQSSLRPFDVHPRRASINLLVPWCHTVTTYTLQQTRGVTQSKCLAYVSQP